MAWGSGNQRRSYLHAFDCARIMNLIMDKSKGKLLQILEQKKQSRYQN